MHEAQTTKEDGLESSFITLTYEDKYLPKDFSLDKSHFQKFMKRLRKKAGRVRFYHCGEYGDLNERPHYHALIFGYDFPDREIFSTQNGIRCYTSSFLSDLWPFGYSTVGDCTFQSAAYVARYIMKKKYGQESQLNYYRMDYSTGEYFGWKQPEYTTMSRRPGIGTEFFNRYKSDFNDGTAILNNYEVKMPDFYLGQFEHSDPELFNTIKSKRRKAAKKLSKENTPHRLQQKQKCLEAKINKLKRTL